MLAALLPHTRWTLLDAMAKRTSFLAQAVRDLGYGERVEVVTGRAEDVVVGRRGAFGLVTARGFGPPAPTAECAAPYLAVGGALVVSEPPGSTGARWPSNGVRILGLQVDAVMPGPPAFVRLRAHSACPPRFPRRVGMAFKRPLFHVEPA